MDTNAISRGLYLLARHLDVGESFTLDRGAESLTFDTTAKNRALAQRVRGLIGGPALFASQVLVDGTLIQHRHVSEFSCWLEPDTRIYVTREPDGLGLVLVRVRSGAKAEAAIGDVDIVADPGPWGPPGPKVGEVMGTLQRVLARQE